MVSSQGLPVASSVPLLEAVGLGEGMLRVRFAAPSAEPACSYMAVYLRTVGTAAWTTVSYDTRRLVESGKKGNSFPVNAGGVVVEGLCAGSWEAQVCAMNCVGWGATSPVSDAVAVLGPKVPPAPSAPLLEAVGEGKLRVRFAAPLAKSPCSYMAVYLRTIGTKWTTVSCDTRRLVESGKKGNSFPVNAGGVVVEDLATGSWEAQVCAMNGVGWGASSPVSDAMAVLGPKAPPAPSAPLLEAVGEGKLRVRFAAPLAKSPCLQMAVYLRTVGTAAWGTVNSLTKRLDEIEKGRKSVPARAGEVVVEGLSAGPWESKVAAMNVVGWGADSPVSSHISVATADDDVAIVGSQSWADRDRELRKRAIDVDAEPQETEEGRKRHRSKMPPTKPSSGFADYAKPKRYTYAP